MPSSFATRAIGRDVSITILTASSLNSDEKLFFGRGNYFTFPEVHPNGWTVRKLRGTPRGGCGLAQRAVKALRLLRVKGDCRIDQERADDAKHHPARHVTGDAEPLDHLAAKSSHLRCAEVGGELPAEPVDAYAYAYGGSRYADHRDKHLAAAMRKEPGGKALRFGVAGSAAADAEDEIDHDAADAAIEHS